MLKFLTGDIWHINFIKRKWLLETALPKQNKTNNYNCASLFSGGMDSLISTINLMQEGKNTLLISHAGEPLTKNAQINIINKLDKAYYIGDIQGDYDATMQAGFDFIHAAYGFGKIDHTVPELKKFSDLPKLLESLIN